MVGRARTSTDEAHLARAGSFGAAAAAYNRGRPPYPAEAVDWLLPHEARRVLDLGAGTGKLTRQLADRGLDVVAVEPSAGMREELARALPTVTLLAGSAEAIPLADNSVDTVLVAQAWHWVDPARAVPEVARVLAPRGRLGLIWNVRDQRQGWVAELGRIMHAHGEEDDTGPDPSVGPPFAPLVRHDFAWESRTTPDGLVDLVASRSYVIVLGDEERAALIADVRHLLATHPALDRTDRIVMPYMTQCYRSHLEPVRALQ